MALIYWENVLKKFKVPLMRLPPHPLVLLLVSIYTSARGEVLWELEHNAMIPKEIHLPFIRAWLWIIRLFASNSWLLLVQCKIIRWHEGSPLVQRRLENVLPWKLPYRLHRCLENLAKNSKDWWGFVCSCARTSAGLIGNYKITIWFWIASDRISWS